ncbi:hypothetical protein COW81_01270 [Candidatus Campbellbacteria bacterium CG22_combo_CG10-13_8_21_14_all_36_13]|uniref:Uncharacterized protein n=1 Tax=Candidatus Campbellbacteria bacterium CG22_combo_CG10-13_8_21_14_all_36_13 TaxID=1974529 RepID=A0A2H0DYI5_9BACT|nr:MAG: hypothetical protein COW81_01270 [Candidatus Campbellbacteria bacterium CG22_combo_CG10-13_8_21_14_all_36_13]
MAIPSGSELYSIIANFRNLNIFITEKHGIGVIFSDRGDFKIRIGPVNGSVVEDIMHILYYAAESAPVLLVDNDDPRARTINPNNLSAEECGVLTREELEIVRNRLLVRGEADIKTMFTPW